MPLIRLLLLCLAMVPGACAPSPPKPRGVFDLSSTPEPGAAATQPTMGPTPHTGGGRLGGP